mgnify:CR=1 FL=1
MSSKNTQKNNERVCLGETVSEICSMVGRRKNQEDAHIVTQLPSGIKLFAIFDGHGCKLISKFASENIEFIFRELQPGFAPEEVTRGIQQLENELFIEAGINPTNTTICNCRADLKNLSILPEDTDLLNYTGTNNRFKMNHLSSMMKCGILEQKRDYPETTDTDIFIRRELCLKSGSTAIIAILDANRLVVASIGDSQGILVKHNHDEDQLIAVDLQNRLHRFNDEKESTRAKLAGNPPSFYNGSLRVGGLNVSRSICDFQSKMVPGIPQNEQPICSMPEISEIELNPDHDVAIILACDGIFENKNSQEVVDLLYNGLNDEDYSKSMENVLDKCYKDGSNDNMTMIFTKLNR